MGEDRLRVWVPASVAVDVADRRQRLSLAPILRARLDRRLPDAERAERYGSLLDRYVVTPDPAEAEVALLPRVAEHTARRDLLAAVRAAEARGLHTLVFAGGDLEPVMPSESVVLLHPGPTRGAQPRARALALPYLFTDRVASPLTRPDGPVPSVAFCGQGAGRPLPAAAQRVRRLVLQARNRVRPRVVAPPVAGHLALRGRALGSLAGHGGVDTRFVVRDRYRAGAATDADRSRTQAEFDENLASATYALCVRGTGNFSARFYEALSFGRVPVFVDTACVLPFEDEVDWRARTVWVDAGDVDRVADRLVDAHLGVLEDPLRSVGALRSLWQDRLTSDGYFAALPATLRRLLGPADPTG